MNNKEQNSWLNKEHPTAPIHDTACELDAEGHCITCSDEMQLAHVIRVDQETQCALVTIEDSTEEEVDISLVETISPGDQLLVHGGVAIARAEQTD